jgi:aldose 1-epimerase
VWPPSGHQFEIHRGTQRAIVVEVGGGLREYEVDGQGVLDGYLLERIADGGRGQPLLPWPNRLADGQYAFGGQKMQLPIDEVSRYNAIHGLTRWLNWTTIEQAADRAVLELVLHPRPGYPFTLRLQISYTLNERGLSVRTSARNLGGDALPFGAGQHPYFTVGTATIDQATLQLTAEHRLELDPERRLPTGRALATTDTDFDFRTPRPIGAQVLDDCFCDLARESDGRARVTLSAAETKRSLTVWMDERYRYVQLFSGDTLSPERRRRGLAIEPMSCPPDAFRSGNDLIVLQSGQTIELEWGVTFDNLLAGA